MATEGAIGAGLTGLMILLFLHDLRSVIVVVANIPLALLGSLLGLWVTGNTINIMSLGGLALSIGILVDMSTVTIENLHVQMDSTKNVATAMLHANEATAVPILLALLCILCVFVPAFIMTDPLRSLFMPLTLAVGFAIITAYLLSATFLPILCIWLVKSKEKDADRAGRVFRTESSIFMASPWNCLVHLCWPVTRSIWSSVVWSSGWWVCRSARSCFRKSIRVNLCCDFGLHRARTSN